MSPINTCGAHLAERHLDSPQPGGEQVFIGTRPRVIARPVSTAVDIVTSMPIRPGTMS